MGDHHTTKLNTVNSKYTIQREDELSELSWTIEHRLNRDRRAREKIIIS